MKKLIYSLTIVLFLCSCEKEKVFDNFPVTLYADKITYKSDIRLFAGQTEVTDKAIIDKFISDAECFKFPDNDYIRPTAIHFHSKDSATLGIFFFNEVVGYSVQKDAKQFLLYSSFSNPVPSLSLGANRDIIYYLNKHTDELIPRLIGSEYQYYTKEVRVGYGSYTNLEMCYLAYKIKRTLKANIDYPDFPNEFNFSNVEGSGNSHMVAGTMFNEFNEKAIDKLHYIHTDELQLIDTLAIMEYKVRYIAK